MSEFSYYHQEEYNVVFANEAIETPVGRFAQVHLTKKTKERKDKKGKTIPGAHSITLLLDKEDKKVKAFYKKIAAAVEEMKELYNNNPRCETEIGKVKKIFWDGDAGEVEKYPHDKGMWKLVATSKDDLPQIFDKKGNEQDAAAVLNGLLGIAFIKPKFHARGVSFALEVVQTLKDDGVRLSSGKPDYKALLSHKDEEDDADTEEEETEEEDTEDEEIEADEEETEDDDAEEDEEESEEEDEDAESDGDGEEDSAEDDDEVPQKKKTAAKAGKQAVKKAKVVEEEEEEESDDDEEEEKPTKKLSAFEKSKQEQAARVAAKKNAVKNAGKGKASAVNLI